MNEPRPRPLGAGDIISASVNLYRENAASLWRLVAVVVVPVQVLSALVIAATARPVVESAAGGSIRVSAGGLGTALGGILVASILTGLAAQLATASAFKAVSDAYAGRRTEWQESLRYAFERFGALIVLLIMAFIGIAVGVLLCIIPGVWLGISWVVAVPVLLIEGRTGYPALKRSMDLVKPRWWSVFGVVLLGTLLVSVAGGIVSGLFGAIVRVLSSGTVASLLSNAVGQSISSVLTTPFFAALVVVLYYDLRLRAEGSGPGWDATPGMPPPAGWQQPPGGPAWQGPETPPSPGDPPPA